DDVTSRALLRWPAAHTRSASPATAIDMPAAIDRAVGCASTSVAAPHMNPSATRLRARPSAVALRALADKSANQPPRFGALAIIVPQRDAVRPRRGPRASRRPAGTSDPACSGADDGIGTHRRATP